MNTENGKRGSRETSLSSLSSHRWKTLSLSLCLSFPSFLPSFLPSSSPFTVVQRFLLLSSLHILLDLPSSLVIPAESSVPSKVPVCRVSLFLPYYEYYDFHSSCFSLSLFLSPIVSFPRPLPRGRRDPRRRVSSSSLVLRPALLPRLFSMAVV